MAIHIPTSPRKTLPAAGLSFDDLANIDFSSLLNQADDTFQQTCPGEGCELAEVQDGEHISSPFNGPQAWSVGPPFYSIAEAAVWLHISLATMKRLLRKGSLPFVRIGARRKIPVSALLAYVICARAGCVLPPPRPTVNSTAYD